MIDLLLTALERLPRLVVAIGALLALGAVMAALTLTATHGGQQRRPAPQYHAAATVPRTSPRRLPPPVSTAAVLQARRVAERFLAGYLAFASLFYQRESCQIDWFGTACTPDSHGRTVA